MSSLIFTEVSHRTSVYWMNTIKAVVASLAFGVAVLVMVVFGTGWIHLDPSTATFFMASGALGLFLGDIFLLKAFTRIGASRSLLIFGFQPLLLGASAYFLFGQTFGWIRAFAVLTLIGCLFSISYERYQENGRWELKGLALALIGMSLDTSGVLLTRTAFESSAALSPFQANLFRLFGALAGFFALGFFLPLRLFDFMAKLTPRWRALAIGASLTGTFLSLSLYLTAVKNGHLASISAIALTGPLFAGFAESALQRRRPGRWYILATLLFLLGGGLLLWSSLHGPSGAAR
jgi:drug/metabolite transporter (DMT)-like permease